MRTIVANIIAIYRRELQSYFASPLSYAIAGMFWLLAGVFFITLLGGLIQQVAMADAQGQQTGIPVPAIDVATEFLNLYLGTLGSLSLFILPMLSMGLYAEERKRGTLELLATSPLTNWSVAVGKLLGVLTFYVSLLLPVFLYELVALGGSDPALPWIVPTLGHVGLVLLAAAVLSLGMFISALTSSTILAAMLTFGVVLLLWAIELVANVATGSVGAAIAHLSLLTHYNDLVSGVLDGGGLALFGSYIALGIFLTAQAIETFRFQQS